MIPCYFSNILSSMVLHVNIIISAKIRMRFGRYICYIIFSNIFLKYFTISDTSFTISVYNIRLLNHLVYTLYKHYCKFALIL
ncbi:MAG: hypothetical protein ACKPKO_54575 [Candidatus Fonsibacter sp.]